MHDFVEILAFDQKGYRVEDIQDWKSAIGFMHDDEVWLQYWYYYRL